MHKAIIKKKNIIIIIIIIMLYLLLQILFLSFYVYSEEIPSNINITQQKKDNNNNYNNQDTHDDNIINSTMDDIHNNSDEISKIKDNIKKYGNSQFDTVFKEFDIEAIMKSAVSGKVDFTPQGILNGLLSLVFNEIRLNISLLAQLIALSLITALLKNLQVSNKNEGASEVAFFICYIFIISIIAVSFKGVTVLVLEVVNGVSQFMQATAPLLITLLVTGGNFVSAGAFEPLLALLISIFVTLIQNIIIPLVFFTAVLFIINNMSERIDLSKLADLSKNLSFWSLGILMTVFIAFILIQGSISATFDGVAGKTAKFAAGTFIPVVGKYLADAADTIVGCTLVIKNAAGLGALIGILAICIIPLAKIIVISLTFRIAAALVGPIADKRVTTVMNDIAGLVSFLFGVAACTSLLFLIAITIIIGASNISAAIR